MYYAYNSANWIITESDTDSGEPIQRNNPYALVDSLFALLATSAR